MVMARRCGFSRENKIHRKDVFGYRGKNMEPAPRDFKSTQNDHCTPFPSATTRATAQACTTPAALDRHCLSRVFGADGHRGNAVAQCHGSENLSRTNRPRTALRKNYSTQSL